MTPGLPLPASIAQLSTDKRSFFESPIRIAPSEIEPDMPTSRN